MVPHNSWNAAVEALPDQSAHIVLHSQGICPEVLSASTGVSTAGTEVGTEMAPSPLRFANGAVTTLWWSVTGLYIPAKQDHLHRTNLFTQL
jgi:hypothetical protein